MSNNDRNRTLHALTPFGNYHNYYAHRTEDRIELLRPLNLFQGKTVLDLGCNAGQVTKAVITSCGARRSVGIDIDQELIAQAEGRWINDHRLAPEGGANAAEDQRIIAIDDSVVCGAGGEKREAAEVQGCRFICSDFMLNDYFTTFDMESSGEADLECSEAQTVVEAKHREKQDGERIRPDVILLLSITKWLHLNHGDVGLLSLFRALYDLLLPEGVLVIEPQEYLNYKKAVRKNRSLRTMFHTLQMRPNFEVELEEIGFILLQVIEREEGGEFVIDRFASDLLRLISTFVPLSQVSRDRCTSGGNRSRIEEGC